MQSDLFHCKVTLHVSGVTAPNISWREVAVPTCEYFVNLLHPLHLPNTLLSVYIYHPKNF